MVDSISPAFVKFPYAGTIVGRMLAGYGELEFDLSRCVAAALDDDDGAIKALFRLRGEQARISVADALMRQRYLYHGIDAQYCETIANMQFCRKIRNNYSHCHWIVENGSLCFVTLEDIVEKNSPLDFKKLKSYPVDDALLDEQEAFFRFTQRGLWYLRFEFEVRAGRAASHPFPMPAKTAQPPEYR